ncbi:MAG: diaminopimelate decarboxylase [Clostridiales bacterium]|nr:diaminopimelate decarboxylase [Clostridiales bacterium]
MNKKNNYYFESADTVKLAEKYGTPLYILSEDIIMKNINNLKRVFINKYKNVQVLYASKAFMSIAMAQIIKREDLGIDVVSGGELYTAIQAEFNPDKIYFHGNNKTFEEIEMAIDYGVGTIVVDNLNELDMIIGIVTAKNIKQKILIRLSPGLTEIDTHEYIITGQRDTKFGFQIDQHLKSSVIAKILNEDSLILSGFHYHIGSQLFDNESYLKAFKIIFELVEWLLSNHDYAIDTLNIGGGFGIPYEEGIKPLDIGKVLEEIMVEIERSFSNIPMDRPRIIIEPGRWIVGPAGITVYKIGSIKTIEHLRTYAAIDGGMSDNIRPSLYGAVYSADVANKYNQAKDHFYTIAGKACESGDILLKDIKLPVLDSGDYLVVHSTGAYNFSMASNYNRMLIPAVVLVKDGKDQVIVKRQTYQDIIGRDIKLMEEK